MRFQVTLAASAAILTLAGCGSPAHPAAQNTARAAAKASPASCMAQFTAWRDGGGLADMQAVSGALTQFGKKNHAAAAAGESAASLSQLGTAAAALQSAAQTAQADPPPACVPGLRADEGAAMADYARTAQAGLDFIQAMQDGDYGTAASDMGAADGAMNAGLNATDAATTDLRNFNGG